MSTTYCVYDLLSLTQLHTICRPVHERGVGEFLGGLGAGAIGGLGLLLGLGAGEDHEASRLALLARLHLHRGA